MTAECRNPDHAAQPRDYCAGCARDCEAELTALNDRYMRLLGDQGRDRRAMAATERRDAQDHMRAFCHLILPGLLNDLMHNVRPALYRATQVDPAMGRRQTDRTRLLSLKNEADFALRAWDERTSMERLPADFAADPREAEITRLRALVVKTGQWMHRATTRPPSCCTCGAYEHDPETTCQGAIPSRPPGWICTCPGCELIRDMDTEGLPEEAQCPNS